MAKSNRFILPDPVHQIQHPATTRCPRILPIGNTVYLALISLLVLSRATEPEVVPVVITTSHHSQERTTQNIPKGHINAKLVYEWIPECLLYPPEGSNCALSIIVSRIIMNHIKGLFLIIEPLGKKGVKMIAHKHTCQKNVDWLMTLVMSGLEMLQPR